MRTYRVILAGLLIVTFFTITILSAGVGSDPLTNIIHLPLVLRGWPPPPPPGRVVISEVLFDPSGSEPDGEWIEIYNSGGLAVDLGEYKIGDEETQGDREGMLQFPASARLEPGKVLVIASNGLVFQAAYGFLPNYEMRESDPGIPNLVKYTAWSGGNIELSNNGDEMLVLDKNDQEVDAVSWGNSTYAFNPAVPAGKDGQSIERLPVTQDTDSAQDWRPQTNPHPGQVVYPTPTPTENVRNFV